MPKNWKNESDELDELDEPRKNMATDDDWPDELDELDEPRKNMAIFKKEGGISYKFIKFITLVGGFSTKTRRKGGDELDEPKISSSFYYHLKVVTKILN